MYKLCEMGEVPKWEESLQYLAFRDESDYYVLHSLVAALYDSYREFTERLNHQLESRLQALKDKPIKKSKAEPPVSSIYDDYEFREDYGEETILESLIDAKDEPKKKHPDNNNIQKDDNDDCPITFERFTHPVFLSCGHTFNKDAVEKALENSSKCPLCSRKNVTVVAINWDIVKRLDLKIENSDSTKRVRKTADHFRQMMQERNKQIADYIIDNSIDPYMEIRDFADGRYRYYSEWENLVKPIFGNVVINENIFKILKEKYVKRGFDVILFGNPPTKIGIRLK